MQNTPYQQLAKEFMDLWQKQIASVISDKQFIQAMLELFQSSQSGLYERKGTAASAHPPHASDADSGMLAELAFRLAMCENRIAVLEKRGGSTKPKRSAKASGSRGSKKPRK